MRKFEETVRKNLVRTKKLFDKSEAIAKELGLTFTDYTRMGLALLNQQYTKENADITKIRLREENYMKENNTSTKLNDLPWSNNSSGVKNGHSWKNISKPWFPKNNI